MVLCCLAVEYFIFYTDEHSVDEDMVTISVQGGGGHYAVGSMVGITQRYVGDAPADASPYVASM